MRVAFASSDGKNVDKHFGQAGVFHVWDIAPGQSNYVGQVCEPAATARDAEDQEDHISAKAAVLEGCAIAYSVQIGGPAAAKLVARHIHPLKTADVVPISDLIDKLQTALRGRVPPWLAKCSGLPVMRSLTAEEDEV